LSHKYGSRFQRLRIYYGPNIIEILIFSNARYKDATAAAECHQLDFKLYMTMH